MKFLRIALPAGFLVALSLAGENPQNPPLVNLNVTAVDGRGQPVTDLTAEDFQILDNGKPRKIVWVHPLSRQGLKPPATFILLDLFNADLAARGLSANEVVHALEKLESADNVYLYLLTPGAKIFAIHAVVPPGAQSEEGKDGPWTQRIKPMLVEALRQVNALKSQDDRLPQLRIPDTWKALADLTSQFAEVPGPKSFIWITQGIENGFEQPGREFYVDTTPLRIFAANLSTLETAIYTVQQRPNGSLAPQNEGSPGDTLAQLTALTGGRAFASDTTEQAIAQAMNSARRMNYRMVFSPDRLDGKYHKIRVTTKRKEVTIQTAQNYYAIAAPDVDARDAAFVSAIGHSPFDYPQISIAATTTAKPATTGGAPGQFGFAIHVDGSDVLFLKDGARYRARLVMALVEYGSNGVMAITDGMPVNLDMSEEDYAKAMKDGIEMMQQAALDEKIRQVRLVVLDRNSNLAGTVTLPIERNP